MGKRNPDIVDIPVECKFACMALFKNVAIPTDFRLSNSLCPVTSIPIEVVSKRFVLLLYNSTKLGVKAPYNFDSSPFVILKLFYLTFKLPVPVSSMNE